MTKRITNTINTIIIQEEPQFVGKMPVRTDIEVLSADEPSARTIGWTCYEQRGAEVFKTGRNNIILGLGDIKVGDQVSVPTLFGYCDMIISEIDGTEAMAESKNIIAPLNFGMDDRNCWTSEMAINKKVFDNLTSTKTDVEIYGDLIDSMNTEGVYESTQYECVLENVLKDENSK